MVEWKKEFIEFSLQKGALQFGEFYLKSGRKSPYFFNSRYFYTGSDLIKLSNFYIKMIIQYPIKINMLFGLAYKGIPIVSVIAVMLKQKYNLNLSYAFNRKEIKTYGDSGNIVGNITKNKKIIIIDDVITSGITINQSIKIINQENKNNDILNVFVALDRQEYGEPEILNTKKKHKEEYSHQIFSIINTYDLIKYLSQKNKYYNNLKSIIKYYKVYGKKDI